MSPTGYTADLPATFAEFALRCARAFGALVTMREEPSTAPIPDEFPPSSYHRKALDEAEEGLQVTSAWSAADAEREAEEHYRAMLGAHGRAVAADQALADRYDAMLAAVEAWTPPTPDHEELKKFMREQLTESKRFDCIEHPMPTRLTGPAYRAERIRTYAWSIEYHTVEHAKELERARDRTEWVRALRASLLPHEEA